MQQCLFCGHFVKLVHVHGHYQCPVCFTNALPCCDGDNCHTNLYFDEKAGDSGKKPINPSDEARSEPFQS